MARGAGWAREERERERERERAVRRSRLKQGAVIELVTDCWARVCCADGAGRWMGGWYQKMGAQNFRSVKVEK